jgi:plasmid stability protein
MFMPQVLVRDIDPAVFDRLKERAKRNGRSFEAELRVILKDAAEKNATVTPELERIRELFRGRPASDSAELLREDRER